MIRIGWRDAISVLGAVVALGVAGCRQLDDAPGSNGSSIRPDFIIRDDQTHNKFSRRIPPALRVPSGSVVEAFAHEATGGQVSRSSTDATAVNMDLVHTLTGAVYVEGAEPGDILAVELLDIDAGDWGGWRSFRILAC